MAVGCKRGSFACIKISILLDEDNDLEEEITHMFKVGLSRSRKFLPN